MKPNLYLGRFLRKARLIIRRLWSWTLRNGIDLLITSHLAWAPTWLKPNLYNLMTSAENQELWNWPAENDCPLVLTEFSTWLTYLCRIGLQLKSGFLHELVLQDVRRFKNLRISLRNITGIVSSFSGNIFSHMTRLDQSLRYLSLAWAVPQSSQFKVESCFLLFIYFGTKWRLLFILNVLYAVGLHLHDIVSRIFRCLSENEWNYDKAALVFTSLKVISAYSLLLFIEKLKKMCKFCFMMQSLPIFTRVSVFTKTMLYTKIILRVRLSLFPFLLTCTNTVLKAHSSELLCLQPCAKIYLVLHHV